MLLALAEWCSAKRWSETGKEASISCFELAVNFKLHSGLTLTPAGTQRRQENIAQRQPKERWTVADTLPGEETAAFFDGGSRGNATNGAVVGAGAVFYDKGVKQWEVEKPIAGRATNNVAEHVGFGEIDAGPRAADAPHHRRQGRQRTGHWADKGREEVQRNHRWMPLAPGTMQTAARHDIQWEFQKHETHQVVERISGHGFALANQQLSVA
ncbi:hypothetical protein DIPPA_04174 [Diplonema papillatum]|nr:hypothetical protein DIPPA_04174 [Diplonema papillatum]